MTAGASAVAWASCDGLCCEWMWLQWSFLEHSVAGSRLEPVRGCRVHLMCLQGRLFVTRDSKLASRRDVGGSIVLLNSNEPADQLAELSKHFGIR